jgi:hypothetical protein
MACEVRCSLLAWSLSYSRAAGGLPVLSVCVLRSWARPAAAVPRVKDELLSPYPTLPHMRACLPSSWKVWDGGRLSMAKA